MLCWVFLFVCQLSDWKSLCLHLPCGPWCISGPIPLSHQLNSKCKCNRAQGWLPAAAKANTSEAGADVKESGLFVDASHLEDGGLTSQSPSPPLSGGRGFHKEGEGNRTKRSREWVERFSTSRRAWSSPIRQVMALRASSWVRHPSSTSSWLHG